MTAWLKRLLIPGLLLIVANAHPAYTESSSDFQLLTPVSLELPTYKKLHTVLDLQSVVGNNIRDINRILISPSLQYELNKHVDIQAGYSNTNRFPNNRLETSHSLFQSVFIHHRLGIHPQWKKLYVGHVLTSEEEFLSDSDKTLVTAAYRLQLGKQLGSSRWRLLASNELIMNVNSPTAMDRAGFNQNRLFVGLGRCLNLHLCGRLGYQMQWLNMTHHPDQINHRLFIGAIINTTGPAHLDRFREKQ